MKEGLDEKNYLPQNHLLAISTNNSVVRRFFGRWKFQGILYCYCLESKSVCLKNLFQVLEDMSI